jgi:membrane-associated phospholipid phosphatase
VTCDFEEAEFAGKSPKFQCRIGPGDSVKVKYGADNGEVYGEVMATRLLWALGFPADRMYPVRVRCRGCPEAIGIATSVPGERLVDPAVIERPLARSQAPEALESWSWPELDGVSEASGGAPLAHRDALKLLAALLQHTDTKPEQQRLVCLGGTLGSGDCRHPFMMLNDVGLTFGEASFINANAISSVNLPRWSATPVWKYNVGCVANLSKSFTGTLRDPLIGEQGRVFLVHLLDEVSDAQLRALFTVSRVEQRLPAANTGSVDQWVAAFRSKQRQVAGRACDVTWSAIAPAFFGTGAILRLQAHASPPLTATMNFLSTLGYMRGLIALAVLFAFAWNMRAGAALLLAVTLSGVLTDAAKSAAGLPRPDAVDSRVQSLTDIPIVADAPNDASATPSVDDDDVFGFPSGHVAVTSAFLLGLALLAGWRGAWVAGAILIPFMALSRLYLGRHFPADIFGGIAVGVVATAIVVRLRLWRLDNPASRGNTALRVGAFGLLALVLALWLDVPPPYEAGRFSGVGAAVMWLGLRGRLVQPEYPGAGWVRTGLAIVMFAAAWWGTAQVLLIAGLSASRIGDLLSGAIPAFVLLPGPVFAERWLRGFSPRIAD